ncbi:AhpC/TSA family protein [Chitinophaga silvatica]|uniref:AhpC/TSA family protein n=1 Tax=Chitinophaga silvatica TaxID=2282649 RepID=A0A3E1Y446_9BACT|nr:TlpA disulfide reductase family protein [Chitinophaga silvatica]RFS19267.1 AhpC/TSA family protein [Chitinophaga silvatica]
MKSLIRLIVLLLLPAFSFAEEGFVIKGKVTGIVSGSVSVIIINREDSQQEFPKVRIENGEFTYTGKIDHPQLVNLKISTKIFPVFLENASYTINSDFESLSGEKLVGGKINGEYNAFIKSGKPHMEFLKANPTMGVAPWLGIMVADTYDHTKEAYSVLSAEGKNSFFGQKLKANLDLYDKSGPGKPMQDFKMSDPSGKAVSIKDFAGKVIVLDFWASWCAPCIGYIPKMREHYNKYKDQGVVFLSVSVDDSPEKWKKAMDEQKMEWNQVLAAGAFSPTEGIRPIFNIKSIPYLIVVDQQGKIAAPLDAYHKDEVASVIEKLIHK